MAFIRFPNPTQLITELSAGQIVRLVISPHYVIHPLTGAEVLEFGVHTSALSAEGHVLHSYTAAAQMSLPEDATPEVIAAARKRYLTCGQHAVQRLRALQAQLTQQGFEVRFGEVNLQDHTVTRARLFVPEVVA